MQALYKKLSKNFGIEKQPRASCSGRMLVSMISDVIPSEEENDFVCARNQVCFGIEGLNGGRIGEMTDSGYPRTVYEWKRGTPLSAATKVHEGERSDVSPNLP